MNKEEKLNLCRSVVVYRKVRNKDGVFIKSDKAVIIPKSSYLKSKDIEDSNDPQRAYQQLRYELDEEATFRKNLPHLYADEKKEDDKPKRGRKPKEPLTDE